MESQPLANGAAEPTPATIVHSARAGGTRWSSKEESALRDLLSTRGGVPRRPDAAFWGEVANELAELGTKLGFGRRTHEAVQHKALSLGIYESSRAPRDRSQSQPRAPLAEIAPRQGTFADFQVAQIDERIALALERVVRELRGSAP